MMSWRTWLQLRGQCCFCQCVLNTDCSGHVALPQRCWRVWVGELFVEGSAGPLHCVTELSVGASEHENKGDSGDRGYLRFRKALWWSAALKSLNENKQPCDNKGVVSCVGKHGAEEQRETVGSLNEERLKVETCMNSVLCSMFTSESGKGRTICWRYQVI